MLGDGLPPHALRGPARVGAAAQVFVADLDDLLLEPDDVHHLVRAMRLRPGEVVVAADGRGRWRRCRLSAGGRRAGVTGAAVLEADGPVETDGGPGPAVTVAFVPVKGERPEWVVQKLTELGVDTIVVLRAARSVVQWEGDRAGRAMERLRRVAREAAAQSRRARLPELRGVSGLAEFGATVAPAPLALADPGGSRLHDELRVLAVGPEGGWDDAEREMPGAVRISLGPSILRAETAAVAAGTLLCALRDGRLGDA